MNKLQKMFQQLSETAFIRHISFLWHWKNFFFLLKYPFWRSRSVWSDKFLGYAYTEYDTIPEGWRKAFGEELSREIKAAGKQSRKRLHKHVSWKNLARFLEIKEKYGKLELYASATEEIEEVLEKYHILSQFYCLHCGKRTKYCTHGWIEYCCEDCFRKTWEYCTTPTDKIEDLKAECLLTEKDIPQIILFEDGKEHIVDLKEKYGIDVAALMSSED